MYEKEPTYEVRSNESGILVISNINTDHYFFVIQNNLLGLQIFQAGWGRQIYEAKGLVDIYNMTTYHADGDKWAIGLPYRNKVLNPHDLYKFKSLGIQKQFDRDDFPHRFGEFNSLCVVTGICE